MNLQDFVAFRQELHRQPEVSGKERETKRKVQEFMSYFQPDEVIEAGQYGLIFCFKGAQPGKSIMIRAELDALPIQETNDMEYKSIVENVSHKCGHDGHMAILTRLAYNLSRQRPEKGKIYLLFQPAEENGAGAKEVFASPAFQQLTIDSIIALHNVPGYPLNSIIVKDGAFTPAVCSLIVKFKGKTSHAAEPEKGLNPAEAISDYLKKALALSQPEESKEHFFLITPIYLTMGSKSYGISAGYGEVHLTVRATDNELLKKQSCQLEALARSTAEQYGLQCAMERTQEFKANFNAPEIVDWVRDAAKSLGLSLIERVEPMKWGEDFGLFTQHFKGAMFGLGAGTGQPALHNPDYDFPDALLETGSDMFEKIVRNFLVE